MSRLNLVGLKEINEYKLLDFLRKEGVITKEQMYNCLQQDIFEKSKFYFFEQIPVKKEPFWFRLTIIFVPIVILLLIIGIPFYYLFTSSWYYGEKFMFIKKWLDRLC